MDTRSQIQIGSLQRTHPCHKRVEPPPPVGTHMWPSTNIYTHPTSSLATARKRSDPVCRPHTYEEGVRCTCHTRDRTRAAQEARQPTPRVCTAWQLKVSPKGGWYTCHVLDLVLVECGLSRAPRHRKWGKNRSRMCTRQRAAQHSLGELERSAGYTRSCTPHTYSARRTPGRQSVGRL